MARSVRAPKLDTRSARAKLGIRREPYWAIMVKGSAIGYRKAPSGGTWIARFRDDDGRQHYQALGAADDHQEADAIKVFTFIQAQDKAREWFRLKAKEAAGDLAPMDGPYTVKAAMDDYVAAYKRKGGKAADRTQGTIDAHILPILGDLPVAKLTKRKLEVWHSMLADTAPRLRTKKGKDQKHREADLSPEGVRRRRSSANRILTVLKAGLNLAHHEGRVADNDAWKRVKPFREADAARIHYLLDDEVKRLVNGCAADFRALVTAAVLTGCRFGELTALHVEDFNHAARTILIRVSKGGKVRHVVLTDEGVRFFDQQTLGKSRDAVLLTRADGKRWGRSDQTRPLAAACIAARIDPPINFHGLRHTYASRLAMKGTPLQVIAEQLGHRDTRMVEKHYGHLAPNYVATTVREMFGTIGIVPPDSKVRLLRHDKQV